MSSGASPYSGIEGRCQRQRVAGVDRTGRGRGAATAVSLLMLKSDDVAMCVFVTGAEVQTEAGGTHLSWCQELHMEWD